MKKHLFYPDWPAPSSISAAVTLRSGGVSGGPYQSWNLASHVGDALSHVHQNRRLLHHRLELPSEPFWLRQVHGTTLLPAERHARRQEGDGSFTRKRGVVCVVLTADCLPVLMTDGETVAAIHAGWRGLLGGILTEAFRKVPWRRRPLVFLGPAISVEAFEVGEEIYRAFLKRSADFDRAFLRRGSRWHADLYRLAKIELKALGVQAIYGGFWCTYREQEKFFSYRRDGRCGRMATLIWRK